jgi:enoyl-CoA hydratase
MSKALHVELTNGVRVITFARHETRNPLSRSVVSQLLAIFDTVAEPVVFTGSRDFFASGANLREISEITTEEAPDFARLGQSLTAKVNSVPHMTIAAVNGYCYGGALDLALSCKRRIATPSAVFAHPGAGLGIITGWGGTQRLPRLVGSAVALEMFFTAGPITAERAWRMGLIDDIDDDPLATAIRMAADLS